MLLTIGAEDTDDNTGAAHIKAALAAAMIDLIVLFIVKISSYIIYLVLVKN